MKCLGLLGGLSPEGSAHYVRLIDSEVRQLLGATHSARLVASMLDRRQLLEYCCEDHWNRLGDVLEIEAVVLYSVGAQALLLDSSVLHVVAEQLRDCGTRMIIHLVDESSLEISKHDVHCVGLVGTRYRAEEKVWIERLRLGGIDVVMPSLEDRNRLNQIMDLDLVNGYGEESARVDFLRIMKTIRRQRAGAIILAAPELALLVDAHHPDFRIIDAARIQVTAAVRWALGFPRSDFPRPIDDRAHETPILEHKQPRQFP